MVLAWALLLAVATVGGAYVYVHVSTLAGLLVMLTAFSGLGWAGGVMWKGRS